MKTIPERFYRHAIPKQSLENRLVVESHIVAVLPHDSVYMRIDLKNTNFCIDSGELHLTKSDLRNLKEDYEASHASDLHTRIVGAVYTNDAIPKLVGIISLRKEYRP